MASNQSSSTVQPATFGGYGRQTGAYGGLDGVEFAARCPPDIQRGTRVVALCGIPDADAAPQADGWFFSDFFLFYQMLSSRSELPNQLWISCCSPKDLVAKHTRYLHGPPDGIAGNRRVVMDKKLLPKDEMKAGFRTCQPKDLLERFLGTLRSEIQEARRCKQAVLVFIFGHGEDNTSGIFVGCGPGGNWKLNKDILASVLDKNVETTLILTSCYSGGWVMKPNANKHFDVKPTFNHSFLTAAGMGNESLSWHLSQTVGRQAAGSVFATCLLNSTITASETSDDRGRLVKVNEEEGGEAFSLSMAGLTEQIVTECKTRCGTLWDLHNFSFAAQDDLWAMACGKRTGMPLSSYKERWERLPEAPVLRILYPSAGALAGSVMSKSPHALNRLVRLKALAYMKAKPGLDNAGSNTNCHPGFHKLIEGHELSLDELERLNDILDFRMYQLGLAELYCRILGISHQRICEFDHTEWHVAQLTAKQGQSPERSKAVILLERFSTVRGWIYSRDVFSTPQTNLGPSYSYTKPKYYLAVMLAQSSLTLQEISEKLDLLVQSNLVQGKQAARSPLGTEILSKPEIKTLRGQLYRTVSKLSQRLRSLSPHKRSPSKVDDIGRQLGGMSLGGPDGNQARKTGP